MVLCLISSSHKTKCCLSLSYSFMEETAPKPNSPSVFPITLMVISSVPDTYCSGRVTGWAVPHDLDACASHIVCTWKAFASSPTYNTATSWACPASWPVLSLSWAAGGTAFLPATTLVCSAYAPMSRCIRPKSHYHLHSGHWMLSSCGIWSKLSYLPTHGSMSMF